MALLGVEDPGLPSMASLPPWWVAMGPWWSHWLEDKGCGWLLPLADPVLGFLLLLPRGDHGPLQLEDTWWGGMLLQMGTPTASRDPGWGPH